MLSQKKVRTVYELTCDCCGVSAGDGGPNARVALRKANLLYWDVCWDQDGWDRCPECVRQGRWPDECDMRPCSLPPTYADFGPLGDGPLADGAIAPVPSTW